VTGTNECSSSGKKLRGGELQENSKDTLLAGGER